MAEEGQEEYKKPQEEEVDGAASLNELVREFNRLGSKWANIYQPIFKAKQALYKTAGLTKVKGSNLKHVVKGLPLVLVVEAKSITQEKLVNAIKIDITNKEEPVSFAIDELSAQGEAMLESFKEFVATILKGI
jgi:hypothetical protein